MKHKTILTAAVLTFNFQLSTFNCFSQANLPGGGNALSFNGTSDMVDLPDNGKYDFSNQDFTVSCWFNLSSYFNNASKVCALIPLISNDDYGWHIGISQAGYPWFGYYYNGTSGSVWLSSSSHIDLNTWHHVTAVFSATASTISIYLDGVQNQTAISNTNIYYGILDSPSIGAMTDCGGDNNFFQGYIDELRIWNRALTQTEIRDNMCQKLTGSEAGLVGYWRFDETSGTTAYDSSPNGNNGTLK